MQRTQSIASVASLSIFRKRDKDWDNLYDNFETNSVSHEHHSDELDDSERHEFAVLSPSPRRSRYALNTNAMINSQSKSATNGLAALRINTPNTIRPSLDGPAHRGSHDLPHLPEEDSLHSPPQSPGYSSPITPDSPLPPLPEERPSYLQLPTPDTSFDSFNLNIDFTKFENTKVEVPKPKSQPASKRITNHDFLFLVDDGPGIDHRGWDGICDLIHGVTKRLVPSTAANPQISTDLPADAPNITLRFINNPRHIARITNLTQIRNIFNWVTPRDLTRFSPARHPSLQQKPGPHIPPLRILEYYFWNIYNTKLQKNAWVGQQIPTTIILFTSSPLANRAEDMDLFVAKCAEKLNADQVPLPLVSIMVVQCNNDPILHRQLADTKRMITWEWYTPKPKLPISSTQPGRKGRQSMLNPAVPEAKKRPQRDWVDIITCVDWERAGGMNALKGMVEGEIRSGTQRRRNLQKEFAMNYLTTLGKDTSPPRETVVPKVVTTQRNGTELSVEDEEDDNRCESPIIPDEIYNHGRGTGGAGANGANGVSGAGRNGYMNGKFRPSQDFHHPRGTYPFGDAIPVGRGVRYYD